MPKLIDYPRTTYSGAWELAEVTDDTGGKCAIETAARKLNRKVSGSFKAIIGSAVKFGLLTSKRDLLSTTTLFKRIKHAYDKEEELVFHREAFLNPPLFTQICRKFRSRELPVQMLDVMLIREFGVEEINAQGVAKAFVEGCRMVGLLDEHNTVADIDALNRRTSIRPELASPPPLANTFRNGPAPSSAAPSPEPVATNEKLPTTTQTEQAAATVPHHKPVLPLAGGDAIASLFGLLDHPAAQPITEEPKLEIGFEKPVPLTAAALAQENQPTPPRPSPVTPTAEQSEQPAADAGYQVQISGPGVNTTLSVADADDVALAIALLEKIRRQLKA